MVNLEIESKKLNNFILKDTISKISISIGMVLYFGILIYSISQRITILPPFFIIVLLSSGGLMLFGAILKKELGKRELLAYSLFIIAQGIKNKNLDKRFLSFVNKKISHFYQEDSEIIKRKTLFEERRLIENEFYKNILSLFKKINYALKNNELKNIPYAKIEYLADSIINKKEEIISLAKQIDYLKIMEESFPTKMDYFKTLLSITIIKFIFIELILISFFILIYLFLTKEVSTLLVCFFTLTAAVITVLFVKKN